MSPLIFLWYLTPINFHLLNNIQWNLYKADTFGTFPNGRLIEVCKNSAMFIQRLLYTVIKFHVVKETKEAVPYFVQDF